MRRLINLALLVVMLFSGIESALAAEDKDESIYVVQERSYSKRGKFEITPIFMVKTNARYNGFVGGALSLAYHAKENFALELTGGYAGNYYSTMVQELYLYEDLSPVDVDLKQMTWFTTLGFQWSPFYGKLRLVPGVLGDFDFYVGAGMGIADTKEPCTTQQSGDAACKLVDRKDENRYSFGIRTPENAADRFKLAGNFSIGLRIFFKEWLGIRIEMRDIVYADKVDNKVGGGTATTSTIRNNLAVFLGLSFLM